MTVPLTCPRVTWENAAAQVRTLETPAGDTIADVIDRVLRFYGRPPLDSLRPITIAMSMDDIDTLIAANVKI